MELERISQEELRSQQFSQAKNTLDSQFNELAQSLGGNEVEYNIKEISDPSEPNNYRVHLSGQINGILPIYNIDWRPLEQELDLDNIMVSAGKKRKGIGSLVLNKTEETARSLGAKKLNVTTLTNNKFKDHLLRNGFQQDPNKEDKVFKTLE